MGTKWAIKRDTGATSVLPTKRPFISFFTRSTSVDMLMGIIRPSRIKIHISNFYNLNKKPSHMTYNLNYKK